MLVEHVFITTLECDEAMQAATAFLIDLGFTGDGSGGDPAKLKMSRGGEKVSQSSNMNDLPQAVHVHFDRGRVSVASSIHEYRKVEETHRRLMLGVVTGLEGVMARGESIERARGPFDLAAAAADEAHRKVKRRNRMVLGCLGVLLLAIFALVITAAMN